MRNLLITTSFTDRTESFKSYTAMINKLPMVNAEEERELALKAKKGDKKAANRLVEANLRFAISVAKHYQNQSNVYDLMDLIEEANIGLIKAVKNYDPTLGYKFISFAVHYIRCSIMDALAKNGSIIQKSSTHIRSIAKIDKAIAQFEQKYQRTPTIEELEELTDIKASNLQLFINQSYNAKSAEEPFDEEGGCLFDILSDENAEATDNLTVENDKKEVLRKAVDRLPLRNKIIISQYFGLDEEAKSLTDIGNEFNLNHESIRQIKNKSLRMLCKDKDLQNLAFAG